MDSVDFREFAKSAVDYIAEYYDDIRNKNVVSNVEPGYLESKLPGEAPLKGQGWQEVLQDVDRLVLPGLTHWHSPNFHAYYPAGHSLTSIVGELVLAGLGTVSNNWESNPACVELEIKMMDWLAILLGLSENFLNSSEGPGGGVIQNSASESTLVALISARCRTVNNILQEKKNLKKSEVEGKLIAYTSEQSNSSVEKAGLLASIQMKLLPTDDQGGLRGLTLAEAIEEDKKSGLIPCCVVATLGTTGTCAFDNLKEIGEVCKREGVWLHVDAAYAGAALSCPEYRYLLNGIEHVDTITFNPHKWLLVNGDCSAMWFRNSKDVERIFKTNSAAPTSEIIPEIEHWQLPSTRKFRALKIWFVLRIYGVQGIQKHIRHQIGLAKYFEQLVRNDHRFELVTCSLGVVCFRLVGEERLTKELLERISKRKKLYIMPYIYQEKFLVRFVVCSWMTEREDIEFAWNEILSQIQMKEAEGMIQYFRNDHKKFLYG